MAPKSFLILCVLAVAAVVSTHGASSSGHHAPAPSADCSNLILNMADCLSFVSNGSTTVKPEGNCCSGLKTVLKADPSCLCQAFKSSGQLGVVLNVTKAMTLPAACKVSASSVTNCGLSVAPVGAPASGGMSPSSSPTSSPASSGATAPEAASELSPAPAPAPSPGSSASSMLSVSAASLLLGLLVATLSLLS